MTSCTCRRCGGAFEHWNPRANLCRACLAPRTCGQCGNPYTPARNNIEAAYCSLACANDAERARHAVHLPLVPPPRTRKDCPTERPCKHTGCRYHLPTACALDVADDGGATQETIADLLGVSKERVKQIEASACRKLVATFGRNALVDILGGQVQPIGHAAPPDPDA